MNPQYVKSKDGARIAFDVEGNGETLILLHGGFLYNRSSWRKAGYLQTLKKEFKVISIDLRGHGQSDTSCEHSFYHIDNFVNDVHAIVSGVKGRHVFVWGYSIGAAIALQLSVALGPEIVKKTILAGLNYHSYHSECTRKNIISVLESIRQAKSEKRLERLNLQPRQLHFAENADIDIALCYYASMSTWNHAAIRDVKCAWYAYCGRKNKAGTEFVLHAADVAGRVKNKYRIYEDLDHEGEFHEVDRVLPAAYEFLNS